MAIRATERHREGRSRGCAVLKERPGKAWGAALRMATEKTLWSRGQSRDPGPVTEARPECLGAARRPAAGTE